MLKRYNEMQERSDNMDEQFSDVLKRLEKIEQDLSEIHNQIEMIKTQTTVNANPTREKKPKGKMLLRICIPILLLCLLAGGYYTFRAIRVSEPTNSGTKSPYAEAEVGDIITFGQYEQNNSQADGKEPIEWIILEKQNEKILLLSKFVLFNESSSGKDWWKNDIRVSLNSDFISEAFLPNEQNMLCETTFETGMQTNDRVFLLSKEEVEKYLPSVESRKSALSLSSNDFSSWWLRSCKSYASEKGNTIYQQYCVNYKGIIYTHSFSDSSLGINRGIRPALWLDTTK